MRKGARKGLPGCAASGFKPHLADLRRASPAHPGRTRPWISRMPHASPWWAPPVHADRRPRLLARNRIEAALRGFFEERGFVEVEAAALQVSPGNEAHLHAFATELSGDRRRGGGRSTSTPRRNSPARSSWRPASGASSTSPGCSATASASALHHPEFTMLEWYRAETPYEALMEDCAALARARGGDRRRDASCAFAARAADPFAEPERLTVAEAFDAPCRHRPPRHARPARRARPRDASPRRRGEPASGSPPDDTWSDVFSRVLVERIEPRLGLGRATILYEYPVSEAALARPTARDPRVAERFELYVCGVELANAFGELTDPAEQRRRFEAEMDEKAARLRRALPDRRGFPGRARRICRRRAASRSASTGW